MSPCQRERLPCRLSRRERVQETALGGCLKEQDAEGSFRAGMLNGACRAVRQSAAYRPVGVLDLSPLQDSAFAG